VGGEATTTLRAVCACACVRVSPVGNQRRDAVRASPNRGVDLGAHATGPPNRACARRVDLHQLAHVKLRDLRQAPHPAPAISPRPPTGPCRRWAHIVTWEVP
jgi:hypothetical protein